MGDEPILSIIQIVTIDKMLNNNCLNNGPYFKVKNWAKFRYVWTLLQDLDSLNLNRLFLIELAGSAALLISAYAFVVADEHHPSRNLNII